MNKKDRFNKIIAITNIMVMVACVAFFAWRTKDMDARFQKEMQWLSLMISRYEAKAQFIEQYLPPVEKYTESGIIARRILAAVYENSLQCKIDPELVLAVITVESQFYPQAKSEAGAIGLMQLMPLTGIYVGNRLGIWVRCDEDLYNIETNIQIGCVFLADCIRQHGDFNGKGFYYASRHSQHYQVYNDLIADAEKIWRANGTP